MSHSLEHIEEQLYLGNLKGACSYLPGELSNLLFLEGRGVGACYRLMLDRGFRRHGFHLYRPDCADCQECRILRVPVSTFEPTASQKRVLRKGESVFRVETGRPEFAPEKSALYMDYLRQQHGTIDTVDEMSYRDFFVNSFLSSTEELRLYAGDRLAGLGIMDLVGDALSSVYFFFDPAYAKYSPGTYSVLKEIEICRERGLSYYYPGFFISGCKAMSYKANFGPAEVRRRGEEKWDRLVKCECEEVDEIISD